MLFYELFDMIPVYAYKLPHKLALESQTTPKTKDLPGLILNLTTFGCLTDINFIGCSVQCLCRSIAEISWKKKENRTKHYHRSHNRERKIISDTSISVANQEDQ
jgi:hypothetical protein